MWGQNVTSVRKNREAKSHESNQGEDAETRQSGDRVQTLEVTLKITLRV